MEDSNKERRELLMMKQNPEGYEDNCFRAAKEKYMKPFSRVENFFYYFKWILIIGGVAAVLVIFMVIQAASREKEDLHVVLISYDHLFVEYEKPLKEVLEKYCSDIDGNGAVYVGVRTVDMTTRDMGSQYNIAESEKFFGELREESAQMMISDEEFYDYANAGSDDGENVFVDLSDIFPKEVLFKGCGLRAGMVFKDAAFPDDLIIYVRAALPEFNNSKGAEECRTRALEVIRAFNSGG